MRIGYLQWPNASASFSGLVVTGFFLSGLLATTPALADAAACKGLADALLAVSKTPYHSTSIITFDSAVPNNAQAELRSSRTSETIFTGNAIFVRFGSGRWQQVHASLDKLKELVRDNAESFADCQRLADKSSDSALLSMYVGHKVSNKLVVTTTKLWVAAGRGVPVRSETDITGGSMPRHVVIQYDYGHVAVPSDAQ